MFLTVVECRVVLRCLLIGIICHFWKFTFSELGEKIDTTL